MADNPVSIARNRPFISEICVITSSNFPGPNRIMGMVDDCASLGAIRCELAATVSTMMTGIPSETGMSDWNKLIPTGSMTLA